MPLDLPGMYGEGRNDLADGLIEDDSTAVIDALSEEAAEARLNGWLNRLGPDARELICRRFGLRGDDVQSPKEMAVRLGRSIAAVQSQLTRSLRQLRAIAVAEGFDAEAVFHKVRLRACKAGTGSAQHPLSLAFLPWPPEG